MFEITNFRSVRKGSSPTALGRNRRKKTTAVLMQQAEFAELERARAEFVAAAKARQRAEEHAREEKGTDRQPTDDSPTSLSPASSEGRAYSPGGTLQLVAAMEAKPIVRHKTFDDLAKDLAEGGDRASMAARPSTASGIFDRASRAPLIRSASQRNKKIKNRNSPPGHKHKPAKQQRPLTAATKLPNHMRWAATE